jgi:tight adherence protein B
MPFVLFAVLNVIRPGYTEPLFESDLGQKLVYGALVSMVLGILVIRRIIRIEV